MNPTTLPFGLRLTDALNDDTGPTITSGDGPPTGSAEIGSLYVDETNGTVWVYQGLVPTLWTPVAGRDVSGETEVLLLPPASVLANTTTDIYWSQRRFNSPVNGIITSLVLSGDGYTSAGGTCTLAVASGAAFGDNVLSTSTVNLETVSAGTDVPLALNADGSVRTLSLGEQLRFRIVSNNADLAGGPLTLRITYNGIT